MEYFEDCNCDEIENLKCLLERTKKTCSLVSPNYLYSRQRGIISESNRKAMIRKITTLSEAQNLSKKSAQLAILLSDLFLSAKAFPNPEYLDLLVYISTNLSSKFEVSKTVPQSAFSLVSCLKISQKLTQAAELIILDIVDWNINIPTPYCVSSAILKAFPLDETNIEYLNQKIEESVLFCLEDYHLSQHNSFMIAVSSIVSSLWRFGMINVSEKLVRSLALHLDFQEEEVKELSKLILQKL